MYCSGISAFSSVPHKWAQDKDDNDARKGASEIRRGFEIATVNEARVK